MPSVIVETERLVLRELDSALDAEFIFALLNSPKFLQYIGDRGVRSAADATAFIDDRYRQSYRDHGYGLYAVIRREDNAQIGLCGFVKRDIFELPDIGFAFLPEFERRGYGYESALAVLAFGRDTLGFSQVLAITSPDNDASGRLLVKLGFRLIGTREMSAGDTVKLYEAEI